MKTVYLTEEQVAYLVDLLNGRVECQEEALDEATEEKAVHDLCDDISFCACLIRDLTKE